jgi:hypothetical protein
MLFLPFGASMYFLSDCIESLSPAPLGDHGTLLLTVSVYYIICVPLQPPPSDLDTQEFSLDVGDKVHFETEPIVVPVTLPPIGTSLGIALVFDND